MATSTGILFYEPRAKPLSAIGLIQPGCYYQFYLTGTTTQANVYSDGALTSAVSQTPGVGGTTAASDGRLIPLYLNPAITYRVQLYSALGALLEDVDPYIPGGIITLGITNVLAYGADPSGATDSSTAFQNAVNSGATMVIVPPPNSGKQYIVHDVTIPSGVTLWADGAYFKDAIGANYVFRLTGFNTKLVGAQISNATNCAQGVIVVDDGNWCEVRSCRIVNGTTPILLKSSSGGSNGFGCSRTQLVDIIGIAFTGVGVDSQPNVHDTQAINLYMDSNTVAGTGGAIPRLGSIGFRFVGTGSTVAFGGHQYTNCNAINMQDGFLFQDANLVKLSNCIADTLCGRGYALQGSTNALDLDNCFAGTCAAGVWSQDTSVNNQVRGLRTYAIGQIPSFGGTNWYSQAGYSTFFELVQKGTSKYAVDVPTWHSSNGPNTHTISEAVALSIQFSGAQRISFNSQTTVAANSTVFLGNGGGQFATEDPVRVLMEQSMVAMAGRVICICNTAPGTSNSFTYTLRVNGADTAITGAISGSGQFGPAAMSGGTVGISQAVDVDLKLVTSASAAAAIHRGYILLFPQPA